MNEFLITYNRSTGQAYVRCFSDPETALNWRMALESEHNEPYIEVASISSDSLENLQRSHSRYFMRGHVTVEEMEEHAAVPQQLAI